jgi:hypothetical protein
MDSSRRHPHLDLARERIAFDPGISDIVGRMARPRVLWFAGWEEFGSRFERSAWMGNVRWAVSEDAIVGPNGFHAHVAPRPTVAPSRSARPAASRPSWCDTGRPQPRRTV